MTPSVRQRHTWSLRQRAYALLLVASLLPTLLVTALLLQRERTTTRDHNVALLSARGDEVGQTLEVLYRAYLGAARRIARDRAVIEFPQGSPAERARNLPATQNHLSDLRDDDRAIRGLGVLDRSGTVIAATEPALLGHSLAYRDYFRSAIGGADTTSEPYLSVPVTGRIPTIAYAIPLRTNDQRIVGVFVLWLDLRSMWDVMRAGNGQAGPGSFCALFDRYGFRIGHSTNDALVFHPSVPVPPEAASAMIASRRFQERTESLLGAVVPFPFDEVRGPERRIFRRYSPTNHAWNLAVTRPFPGLGWTLVTHIPESAIEVRLGSLVPQFASASLAGLALCLLGGALFMRQFVQPIRRLASATSALERGNFDPRLTEQALDLDAGGEVGELARAFQSMTVALADRDQRLRERNRDLQQVLDSERRMQAELQQAQKLEAVGRLASGIAHEINTPIQYIGDNTRFLEEAFGAICELLRLHRQALEASTLPDAARQELVVACEHAELEYLLEQGPKSIARTLEGLQRVATIVRAMKEFAHPDQKEMVATDLNRALLATLEVTRNEYKYVAEVETDLGELPRVTCHAGDVNQVFLNIVVNAAHAVEDVVRGTHRRGTIGVQTRREGDSVVVAISDTGAGIPAAVRDRVFDPFFTTKEVGRGSGQGLSIARSVVVNHQGALTFETREGEGTTFFIRLPISPAVAVQG
jgi:C4-dicarboxylate-specific signal transduction histidine kinase